jgi:hypothetical protein
MNRIIKQCSLILSELSADAKRHLMLGLGIILREDVVACFKAYTRAGPATSLVSTIEELLGRKSSCSGLENRECGRRGYAVLTTQHPSIRKRWH